MRHAHLLLTAGLLLVPALASATVGRDPVLVRIEGDPRPAAAGRPYQGALLLTSHREVELSGFRLEGRAWSASWLDAPGRARIGRGDTLRIPFRSVPGDPSAPLVLAFDHDGGAERAALDLSPSRIARLTRRRAARPIRDSRAHGREQSAEREAVAGEAPGSERGAGVLAARDIRVRGGFAYVRGDGVWMPADDITVEVYTERFGRGTLAATTRTDAAGAYDVTFHWSFNDVHPDITVAFVAENDDARVIDDCGFGGCQPYRWQSDTVEDYAGSDLVVRWLGPGALGEEEDQAVHILTTLTRTARWLDGLGHRPGQAYVRWPASGNNSRFSEGGIYMVPNQEWSEDTMIHEFGHFWIDAFGRASGSDYCNDLCDPDNGDPCRHCDWCEETAGDAWNEGFSDWLGDYATRVVLPSMGPAPMSTRNNFETVGVCIERGFNGANDDSGRVCPCDPLKTEGFLSALLRDIEDSSQDDDPSYPGTRDRLREGPAIILRVAREDDPDTPLRFLLSLAARYTGDTGKRARLWETAMNNGYDIDFASPDLVTNLTSPSHEWTRMFPGDRSPDATVEYTWTRAEDDISGILGYSYVISTDPGALPDLNPDLGDVTRFVSAPLAPDNDYWFVIRTLDRSGKWSDATTRYGPVRIRAAEPVDLYPYLFGGWADVLVPRDVDEPPASGARCDPPATLRGNGYFTHWNLSGRNSGDEGTDSFDANLRVDGVYAANLIVPPVGPPTSRTFFAVNQGPIFVPGGRHTFEMFLDARETISEADEVDNRWAHQWVWTPFEMTQDTRVESSAPPDATGGWEAIVDGSPRFPNCDGYRFFTDAAHSTGFWNAVWAYAWSDDDDYDVALHAASAGPDDGFGAMLAFSGHTAGRLDAVIVNNNVVLPTTWDAGVRDANGDRDGAEGRGGSYHVQQVASEVIDFGRRIAVALPLNEMLLLREVWVEEAGHVNVTVEVDPPDEILNVLWLPASFGTGSLSALDRTVEVTGVGGRARLEVRAAAAGWYCVAVYRNPSGEGARVAAVAAATGSASDRSASAARSPKEPAAPSPSFPALDLEVLVEWAPPDLEPFTPLGWHAPLVPTEQPSLTSGIAPAPSFLAGNGPSTFLNCAVLNASPSPAPAGLVSRYFLDGHPLGEVVWTSAFSDSGSSFAGDSVPRTVRGGRHTISVRHDPDSLVNEGDEHDNVYGEQWLWSPFMPATTGLATRPAPPERMGGWSDLRGSEGRWFNCDGLRTPVFAPSGDDGWWAAAAVMPGPGSDVDLRLHELATSVKDGFAASLAFSGWGRGQSDYVLVNFLQMPHRAFDAGVLLGEGAEDYVFVTQASVARGTAEPGAYGPFTLGAGDLLHLHDFLFHFPGRYRFRIENLSGQVDWGMTLHGPEEPYQAKSGGVPDGSAWLSGPGWDEEFAVTIEVEGFHCLAVWKARAEDLGIAGVYRITLEEVAVEVPGALPAVSSTRLREVRPNPSVSHATIAFELAREQEIRLEVFDLRGARVRTLARGRWPAGNHTLAWDGRGAEGSRVAAGMYLVRLEAGGITETRRLAILR